MKTIIFLFTLLILISSEGLAQSGKVARADKHYKSLNYNQALKLYQKEYAKCKTPCLEQELIEKIANCYRLTGNTKSAEAWYEKIVAVGNIDKINYVYYAQMLQVNGKLDEAKKWFDKYSVLIGKNKVVSNFLLDESVISTMEKEILQFDISLLGMNSNKSDMGPIFYNEKLVFLSTRDSFSLIRNGWDNEPFFDIYVTQKDTAGQYAKAKKFSKKLNTPYHEGPMCFHPRYDIVYFTRSNNKETEKNNKKIKRLSIYKALKDKKGWTSGEKLWFNSPDYSYAHPTISPDGMVLIFVSDKEGGFGGTDLYFSFWNDTTWSEPINLGSKINTKGDEVFPHFSPDGKLYFSSNGRKGLGGLDIFCTYPSFEDVKEIRNAGMPINSTHDDFGIVKDKNDKGFFVSNRPNEKYKSDNIYSFTTYYAPTLKDDTLEIPSNVYINDKVTFNILEDKIKEQGNTDIVSLEIITDGDFAKEYSSSNNGEFTYWVNKSFNGMKKIDYVVTNKRGLRDTASIYLVMEGNTPPTANPDRLYALKNGKGRVIDVLSNDVDKENNIMVDSISIIKYPEHGGEIIQERRYVYYAPPKDFVGLDYCVYQIKDARGGIDTDTIFLNVMPEFMGQAITMGRELDMTVHFKFNKSWIDYSERRKLDRVAKFFNDNESIQSQVIGHTDPVGGSNYNMILSLKRAKETAKYLKTQGVNEKRMDVKGKGESELIYKSIVENNRHDANNLANRRTTIKVIEY